MAHDESETRDIGNGGLSEHLAMNQSLQGPQRKRVVKSTQSRKATRQVSERPIPSMGWPAFLYRLSLLIGRPQWVPKLSNAEVEAHIQMDLFAYKTELEESIRRTTQRRTFTATVTHVKGGAAKTTNSGYMGSVLGETARKTVTIIDNNPMWGTTARLLGIQTEETLTIRSVKKRLDDGKLQNHQQFVGALGSTKHNVSLIASDAVSRRDDMYDHETAKQVITNAQENSIFVINDTSNHIGGDAMQAALELSDVMVVPTILTGNSLEGARVTIDSFKNWEHSQLVRHSIAVVSGLQPGDSAEQYRDKLGLSEDHILLGIPFEQRLKDDEVIDLAKNDLYTVIAYLELVFVVTKVAKYVQEYGYEGDPLKFEQGRLVSIPSGRTPVLPYV